MTNHIVKSYENELKRLRALMTEMGGTVENQVELAIQGVVQGDAAAAAKAIDADPAVDAMEYEAEQFVIRMLALRQPMAQDLRQIVSSLKMTTDLERIGDYATNVAKRSVVLSQFSLSFPLSGLAQMARLVQENLKMVVDAIGDGDTEKALQVWRSDAPIDDLYNSIFRELITYMMEDPRNITPCTHLLFIAKNLERIGDHATNIAETIYYAVAGEPLTAARPKADNSPFAIVRPAGA